MKLFKEKRAFFVSLVIGTVISVVVSLFRGVGAGKTAAENLIGFSAGFFVTGVLFAGIGGLLIISTATDFFDMLTYGFKSLVVLFTPFKNPKDHPRFYDYKQIRKEKRGEVKTFLLFAGLALIALSALALGISGLIVQ